MYPLRPPSISMHCMLSVLCTLMMQCPSLLDWPDHLFVACYGPAIDGRVNKVGVAGHGWWDESQTPHYMVALTELSRSHIVVIL